MSCEFLGSVSLYFGGGTSPILLPTDYKSAGAWERSDFKSVRACAAEPSGISAGAMVVVGVIRMF